MLVDPVNGTTKCSMEIVRLPRRGEKRVDCNCNPAASKRECHSNVWILDGVVLPRPLELGRLDLLTQFRNEPLH